MQTVNVEGYTILHLGCGVAKPPGHFGIDINPRSHADLILDLDMTPWPLPDGHFEEVYCPAIIEHLRNFFRVFEEIHRVSKNGARVYISVPHYTDTAAFSDPTHVLHLNSFSFDILTQETLFSFYTKARFHVVSFQIVMLKLWKWIGIQWLVNSGFRCPWFQFIRKFWENYCCFIFRAKSMEIVIKVVK